MPSDRLEVPPNLLRPEQELGGREADRDARLAAGKVLVAGEWRAGDRNLEIVYAAQLDPIRRVATAPKGREESRAGFRYRCVGTHRSIGTEPSGEAHGEVLCEERVRRDLVDDELLRQCIKIAQEISP